LKHISLDESANGTYTGTFDGVTYTGNVATDLDLTHTDLILYYEILDNYVSVDVGLDVKKFDGKLEIRDPANASNTSSNTIDDTLPMLYLAAEVELPLTGLSVGAEVSAIKYSGDSLQDAKVKLRQGFGLAFVELGYRQISIDIEDVSDVDVDVDLSGAYLSTGIDF
jgi:outer membrane protein